MVEGVKIKEANSGVMHIRKKSERGSEKQYMVDGKEIPMVCSIRSPGLELCTPECHCYGKWEICQWCGW